MHPRPRLLLPAAALILVVGATAYAVRPAEANDRSIVVQAGDTLGGIALQTGIPVETLVRINAIDDPDHITVGQQLRLEPTTTTPPAATNTTHRVASGETLSTIAVRYGTTVTEIVRANGIADPSYVQAGAVLRIPGDQQAPAAPPAVATHRVASGETLSTIAVRYGTTVTEIVRANGIADPSYVQAGAVLRIPGADRAVAVPESMLHRVQARADVRAMITSEAKRQGVPTAFALAVAWQESGWQQDLVSAAGAIGIMQLLPATGDWVSAAMLGEPVHLRDARSNVRAGVALLGFYLDRYAGSRELALAAYYQGMTAADRSGVYAVSRPYIASILALEAIFSH